MEDVTLHMGWRGSREGARSQGPVMAFKQMPLLTQILHVGTTSQSILDGPLGTKRATHEFVGEHFKFKPQPELTLNFILIDFICNLFSQCSLFSMSWTLWKIWRKQLRWIKSKIIPSYRSWSSHACWGRGWIKFMKETNSTSRNWPSLLYSQG